MNDARSVLSSLFVESLPAPLLSASRLHLEIMSIHRCAGTKRWEKIL